LLLPTIEMDFLKPWEVGLNVWKIGEVEAIAKV
jgi:hypothetical protein